MLNNKTKIMLDQHDKLNIINRCFFDAEHGWLTLALDRLEFLHENFPDDPQVEYAEGLIRKDFFGDGIRAEELFISAHGNATDRNRTNENFLFSTFNAAKYALSEEEFRKWFKKAFELAPKDSDIEFFNSIIATLNNGISYTDILSGAVAEYQKHQKYGDCASFAQIAFNTEELSFDAELGLRKTRLWALRELDKVAELSRTTRGEGFAPDERLTLKTALNELEITLKLDPDDHTLWNFKSAWLILMKDFEGAISAAETALKLCPTGYLRPHTNRILSLIRLKSIKEAKIAIEKALKEAEKIGEEARGDKELINNMRKEINTKSLAKSDQLEVIAQRIIGAHQLTARQEMSQWKDSNDGALLLDGLKKRVRIIGNSWSTQYIKMMEEMLIYFTPETCIVGTLKLSDSNQVAYAHCLNAIIYLAAHREGIVQRDTCRFLIYMILGAVEPDKIQIVYREAILGPTTIGTDKFSLLEQNMHAEIQKFNPVLLKLIADQPPLSSVELNKARVITMARFIDGISRDPDIRKKSCWKRFLKRLGL